MNLLPILIGVADMAALAGYIGNFSSVIAQAAALALKVVLVPLLVKPDSILLRQLPSLLILLACCLISLTFSTVQIEGSLVQSLGFLGHLTLTLLLTPRQLTPYLKTIGIIAAASAVLFIGMAWTGRINTFFDRYYYFSDTQPNLGAEIAAMGAVCAALVFRMSIYAALIAPMVASAAMLQGRAGILTIAAAFLIKLALVVFETAKSPRTRGWIVAAVPLALLVLAIGTPFLIQSMQLDDQYRGLGSGASGRVELWAQAIGAFQEHPLTGIGLGAYATLEMLGPHNFFLYGVAEMGLCFVPVLAVLLTLTYRSFRTYGWTALYLLAVLPLLMFNARFMNLNPYPFMFFVLVFALATSPAPVTARTSRRTTPAAGDGAGGVVLRQPA